MPDVYAAIAEADLAAQERLAAILELRAADPQQRAILDAYLAAVVFPGRVGAGGRLRNGGGHAAAGRPGVAEAVGVDPSPVFVAKAGELAAGLGNVSFEEGDGRALRFGDGDFATITVALGEADPSRTASRP